MPEKKTRLKIELTDRAPVIICKEDWPLIASAKDWDNQYEFQANRTWHLKVRQHKDGRAVVYGVYDTCFQNEHNAAGGMMLEAGADLAAAINAVADELGFERRLAQECIQDLPAEDLCPCDEQTVDAH